MARRIAALLGIAAILGLVAALAWWVWIHHTRGDSASDSAGTSVILMLR